MSKEKQMNEKRLDNEEELRRSEERLRIILESAQGFAIFTTDADGVINSWYAGAAQVFGWSEAEILGQKCNVTFTPEDQASGEPEKERETARRKAPRQTSVGINARMARASLSTA